MRSNYLATSIARMNTTKSRLALIRPTMVVLLIVVLAGGFLQAPAQDRSPTGSPQSRSEHSYQSPQTYTREGVSVEFSIEPLALEEAKTTELLAGTEARVQFTIRDANGGNPLSNLRPIAWINQREFAGAPDVKDCHKQIQSFMQSGLSKSPNIDLNAYFILALNHESNISVIDPLSGFQGSRLYSLVSLPSPGEDWVMSPDNKRLYVSMPLVGQVAVIDTMNWRLIASMNVGANPTRIALQHDGRYLWVGNDSTEEKASGITVIDTMTLKVATELKTGVGHHEIAFTDDDSFAFVTNKQSGTLSVINVRQLARLPDIDIGSRPTALAFSPLSRALYVANEGDGTIVAVDGVRLTILARIKAQVGLGTIRIPPNGRFGFVIGRATDTVGIFDISTNRLVHVLPVGSGADQIIFTRQFAYIRSTGSEFVTMIKLSELGKEAAVTQFPAGQKTPRESPAHSLADAIVPTPEDGAVLVANPADKMIYFYTEGMAAPMGSFQNYRRDPKALLVLDKSLRENAPGVYATTVRLTGPGHYDVAFLLDSPLVVNCFGITIAENPGLPKSTAETIKIEPFVTDKPARVGESYNLRFRVSNLVSREPDIGLKDLGVLIFLTPGIWNHRESAKAVGDGFYEASFIPPQSGVYYVYFECPSLSVHFNEVTPLTLQIVK
jgi:DNA-binding beta-propeller fold protein YncE